MEKIIVIGCPGSGKTEFSKKLADITGLPLVHLDRYYHDETLWKRDPEKKRAQWRDWIISQIQKERWIIDGNYKSTLDIRIPEADTILFLDYSRLLSIWRIFTRRLFSPGPRTDMPLLWKERIGWQLLRFAWNYNQQERPRILEFLAKNESDKRIVILEHPERSEQFLADVLLTKSASHPRS